MTPARCLACGGASLQPFYRVPRVPVNSCLMVDDRTRALDFPTGELALAFCESCGFVQNTAFDPALTRYQSGYEETQAFSPRFMAFARELADDLVRRHGLRGRSAVEIGCGKGEFLVLLAERGIAHGVGVDPGVDLERLAGVHPDVLEFVAERYSPEHEDLAADVIVCRHTLEHIPDVAAFVDRIASGRAVSGGAPVFVEVPDVRRVLVEGAFWDLYYEHCSYFSQGSLARLMRARGFGVERNELAFDGQYLLLDARTGIDTDSLTEAAEEPVEALAADVARFVERIAAVRERWADRLAAQPHGGRTVLWGSGSKAVSFLTTLGLGDEVAAVVDVNPHKHGKHLAGAGHEIVAPSRLGTLDPSLVVAMNPIYRSEIAADLDRLGVHAELVTV